MKINVELLKKVKKHILEEPRRLLMDDLVVRKMDDEDFVADDGKMVKFASCGTAACIAEWSVLLTDGLWPEGDLWRRAAKLLGIPKDQICSNGFYDDNGEYISIPVLAEKLFYVDEWPVAYRIPYKKARSQKQRAKIAAKRIEAFIRKYRKSA